MSRYVTLSQLKAFRPTNSTAVLDFSAFSDDELQDILDDAEASVESLTNNIFYSKTSSFRINGNGQKKLFTHVKEPYKILTITSVTEVDFYGNTLKTLTEDVDFMVEHYWLELDDSYYSIRSAVNHGVWPRGTKNISISGTFGMTSTPALIERAIKLLAVCNSLGPSYAGIGVGGDGVGDIVQEVWTDYTVTYRGNQASQASRQKGVSNLTGYLEIDRILSQYINYADMFILADVGE